MGEREALKSLTKKRDILLPLGFEEVSLGIYIHKMLKGEEFDFTTTDPDVYWIMNRIFSVSINHGIKKNQQYIKNALGIPLD